ncbi:hypothetical protein GCM10007276_11760 [Agaricicola taiwanensis]|uniref:Type III secretion protein n=1 Tax=Agaricicola taiwanensis TaxID=591372 RepID=A0A8J2VQQ3_9RHOB|nr:YscO family type III secretion system apparatus protein [Agaricicola taiwanensis]GGE35954.1 hypothetical protein GCM10007276_11760 [Agaricicola taiwanensis]
MKEHRTVKALLALRKLHETRAAERVVASEAALRAAERDAVDTRVQHKDYMTSLQEHERDILGSIHSKVMSPHELENIQDSLDAFKAQGNTLAKKVAKAQSSMRSRSNELRAAQEHLKQKQREHLKLETYDQELDAADEIRDLIITENDDADRAQTGKQYQLKPI